MDVSPQLVFGTIAVVFVFLILWLIALLIRAAWRYFLPNCAVCGQRIGWAEQRHEVKKLRGFVPELTETYFIHNPCWNEHQDEIQRELRALRHVHETLPLFNIEVDGERLV